jgi:hypothetical protein
MPNIKKHANKVRTMDKLIQQNANEFIVGIIKRTQSGRDANMSGFRPYSKGYALEKAKEFGSSRVNLTRTGNMLNSITHKRIRGGVRLYFSAGEELRKADANQNKLGRRFFGLDKKQILFAKDKLKKHWRKA